MEKVKEKVAFLEKFETGAQSKSGENKAFLKRLRNLKPSNLDEVTETYHHEVFLEIDCLECANCCKTTSPILIDRDIDRISRQLKMKPSGLIERYLKMDEEGDYIFREAPCPFLMPDNYCMIYDVRPRACREYPHTNRKRFYQILQLTWRNTLVCPAALEVVKRLKNHYSNAKK